MRTYMLAKRFGWTPNEILDQPAVICDWLLAIGSAEDSVRAEQQNRSSR